MGLYSCLVVEKPVGFEVFSLHSVSQHMPKHQSTSYYCQVMFSSLSLPAGCCPSVASINNSYADTVSVSGLEFTGIDTDGPTGDG